MNRADSLYYRIIKTVGDYLFSLIFLVILSPICLLLSLIIFITGGNPVIYSQERTGRNGKKFRIYKFRSLRHSLNEGTDLVADRNDKRTTRIGRVMRRFRLDEIPNFINVLKGDMSIVGPRPEQEYYINQLAVKNPEYSKLLTVKPGITSWGEVKYGYASNVDQMLERLEYDLYYLKNRSLWFDLKIMAATAGTILKGKGI
jgi:lipopolysaccharide/colanic/teichoic acid biosynthesis glycosyltransferase